MIPRAFRQASETQKKRHLIKRMVFLHSFLGVCLLIVVARLIELQVIDRSEYRAAAQSQHFGGRKLPAQRGQVLTLNSKTGETTILATNTTLDLLYVDPLIVDNPAGIAERLADTLLTDAFHQACSKGLDTCPRELINFYAEAFDPLSFAKRAASGVLLEPLPAVLPTGPAPGGRIPDVIEMRRMFARDIESRISDKRVTFVPVKYSATKIQMNKVKELNAPGISISWDQKLIYADPEQTGKGSVSALARKLAEILDVDAEVLQTSMRSRPLRYVPIMRRLTPALSLKIKEMQLKSLQETNKRRSEAATREAAEKIADPLRSIALLPEHWRYYPDGTIASQVVGFLNTNQEAQYGVERTFDAQLRGQEGLISTVSDPHGGQILTSEQRIVDPKDGDTVVLTIDPFIQKKVEDIMERTLREYDAESAQAIVMDPYSGRLLAMVNAPLFERNSYAEVFEKEPIAVPPDKEASIVIEVFHPETNVRIVKAYYKDVFSVEKRKLLPEKIQQSLAEAEQLYDLKDIARYYLYIGQNSRREVFPTNIPGVWLKFKNNLGVGAYLNRTIQQIYEPGSVMKSVTMAIAIDQGEVVPSDVYDDTGPVKVDRYEIKNALLKYYGKVSMTNCIEWSINTCMTSISEKLGRRLFRRMLERFGFGKITGIELDDELPGDIIPLSDWNVALLATASFGQGVSVTPLQMITAWSPLANGGKLMKPTIVDRVIHADGTVEVNEPVIVDQVITPQTSETITAMLVSSADVGFAKTGKVPGYKVAGKTGTSQIAGPGGRYEVGTGSTIGTYMGYAPPHNAKFLILVKFDRSKDEFGSYTAGPVFKEIATYLFQYYGLPPDEK
jgi:cell division protein FtsI/penicillin-binding protein 2